MWGRFAPSREPGFAQLVLMHTSNVCACSVVAQLRSCNSPLHLTTVMAQYLRLGRSEDMRLVRGASSRYICCFFVQLTRLADGMKFNLISYSGRSMFEQLQVCSHVAGLLACGRFGFLPRHSQCRAQITLPNTEYPTLKYVDGTPFACMRV